MEILKGRTMQLMINKIKKIKLLTLILLFAANLQAQRMIKSNISIKSLGKQKSGSYYTSFTITFRIDPLTAEGIDYLLCPTFVFRQDTFTLDNLRDYNRFFLNGMYVMNKRGKLFSAANILPSQIRDSIQCFSGSGYFMDYDLGVPIVLNIETRIGFLGYYKGLKLVFYYEDLQKNRFVFISNKLTGK